MSFAKPGNSRPLTLVAEGSAVPQAHRDWAAAQGFTGALGQLCLLPGAGGIVGALFGIGSEASRKRGRFALAAAAEKLPEGDWHLEGETAALDLTEQALGWLLAGYRFDRYKTMKPLKARLVPPQGVDAARLEIIAEGERLTRDLVNTPAADLGPQELEQAARDLATRHGASVEVTQGAPLEQGFPMIHAVGKGSPRAPRLIDLRWGTEGPALTLVGKGVCFDTGGLDLKPANGMQIMKKDMGGAATVLGLAHMVMALGLKLRLRVLIPAVENLVSGTSMLPKDILRSRKGLTVEVNDTDAEGRLVLGDALAYACEDPPDLLVSMATLTGAARVAVGPDLAPYYTDDEPLAAALQAASMRVADPCWRLPFWTPYESVIEPDLADLDNAPGFGFAGSITAALFLRRFVSGPRYVHFDIYAWQPTAAPARPKGGVGMGARALLEALPEVLP